MKSTRWYGIGSTTLAGFLIGASLISATPPIDRITVVCDHDGATANAEASSIDGLSIFVKFQGEALLIDTGGGTCPLMRNLDESGIAATSINAIVLSSNRSDHIQALASVLKAATKQPKIYVPARASEDILQQAPQANIVAVSKPVGILPNAWLVGPLQRKRGGRKTAEQVLVLYQPEGLVVYVGCSHPEIVSVVERVRETFGYQKIKLLAGGIHLRGRSKNDVREISLGLQQMGVRSLALSRCTGRRALKIFRDEWGDRLVPFNRGDMIDLS